MKKYQNPLQPPTRVRLRGIILCIVFFVTFSHILPWYSYQKNLKQLKEQAQSGDVYAAWKVVGYLKHKNISPDSIEMQKWIKKTHDLTGQNIENLKKSADEGDENALFIVIAYMLDNTPLLSDTQLIHWLEKSKTLSFADKYFYLTLTVPKRSEKYNNYRQRSAYSGNSTMLLEEAIDAFESQDYKRSAYLYYILKVNNAFTDVSGFGPDRSYFFPAPYKERRNKNYKMLEKSLPKYLNDKELADLRYKAQRWRPGTFIRIPAAIQ